MRLLYYFNLFIWATTLLAQNNEPDFKVNAVKSDSSFFVVFQSKVYAPIDFFIKMDGTDSIIISQVIKPFDSIVVYDLGRGVKDSLVKDFNETYDIGYFLGDPESIKPDFNYKYLLPFMIGKKYLINQGANGKFSHNSDISRYAIDFGLSIGEPVYAAREGIVVKVIDTFSEAGGEEYRWKANQILVLHEDGTIASYVHLDKDGSVVCEGDRVERGQLIGYSGNTGYSKGPHLHFVVRKEKDFAIPVYFEGYEGVELKAGKKYKRVK